MNSTESLWVRGVPPGGEIVGDPKDPQIVRLLARGQIKKKAQEAQSKRATDAQVDAALAEIRKQYEGSEK